MNKDLLPDPSVRRHTTPARPGTGIRRPVQPLNVIPVENLAPLTLFSQIDIDDTSKKVRIGQTSLMRSGDRSKERRTSSKEAADAGLDVDDKSQPIPTSNERVNDIASKTFAVKMGSSVSLVELKPSCNRLKVQDFAKMKVSRTFVNSSGTRKVNWSKNDRRPKSAANSVFQEKEKEEAVQRKKYGKLLKDIKPAEGPMIMTVTGKDASRHTLTGHRQEINNSQGSYYVMVHTTEGEFTAYPVSQWYQFEPSLKYKTLTIEEADEEYERRDKVLNHFSVMVKKRLQGEDVEDSEEKYHHLKKMSGLDGDSEPWIDSDEDDVEDEERLHANGCLEKKKGLKKKSGKHQRKAKLGAEEEDEDDNELNAVNAGGTPYQSCEESFSESESEVEEEKKMYQQGVDEEAGLKDLLKWESDSSSEDEVEELRKKTSEEQALEDKKPSKKRKKISGMKHRDEEKVNKEKSSNSESKKSNSAFLSKLKEKSTLKLESNGIEIKEDSCSTNKSLKFKIEKQGTWNIKRLAEEPLDESTPAKQAKKEIPKAALKRADEAGVTEDAVRRYLRRKPISVAKLCEKFRSKSIKLSKEDLSDAIAHHLTSLNPAKQILKEKMLLFIPTEADHNSLYLSMIDKQSLSQPKSKSP